ncbi:hypothetical protein GGTG_04612 [Gaeumannomyces tritici R3-111a-1]|uniref:Uncharacterized protein n=1 Tax=Gaeumannomyces tritici (strain R3-111a-1) TaxID=644352 RepID=J3NTL2_GAET3|nr:hypothetical protein GGTG_04612 [Gaeumannomyces tritici R3-111a-1]EJT79527.1 hypothetical protein GGTG_04612 [Gaeumannomyces tritici R3-111a-1]
MRNMVRRLISAGASPEAWGCSSSELSYRGAGLDGRHGHTDGTPLVWSMQANCRQAVEIILDLGVKVFPQSEPASRRGRYYSPVCWAARMHQTSTPADYSDAFPNAWMRGHERAANSIFERAGRYGVDKVTYYPHIDTYLVQGEKFHKTAHGHDAT